MNALFPKFQSLNILGRGATPKYSLSIDARTRLTNYQLALLEEEKDAGIAEYKSLCMSVYRHFRQDYRSPLLRPFVRNPYLSETFDYLCRVQIAKRLANFDGCVEVSSSSFLKSKALEREFVNTPNVRIVSPIRSMAIVKTIALLLVNVIKTVYAGLLFFVFTRVCIKKRNNQHEVVLVDTFLTEKLITDEGKFIDRYFQLRENERGNVIVLVPCLINLKTPYEIYKLIQRLGKSKASFLSIEREVGFIRYLSAFFLAIWLPLKHIMLVARSDFPNKQIVIHDLIGDIASTALFKSLLRYFFFSEIGNHRKLNGYLSWFENQRVDHASILGLRSNQQYCPTHGYQGFLVSEYFSCGTVEQFEVDAGLIPDTLFNISPCSNQMANSYLTGVEVKPASSRRHNHIWDINLPAAKSRKQVLIVCPLDIQTTVTLLSEILRSEAFKKYDIVIRKHPTHTLAQVTKFQHLFDKFVLSKADLVEQFKVTRAVISTSSTMTAECVAIGIPVILMSELTRFIDNPLPRSLSKNHIFYAFDTNQVGDALSEIFRRGSYKPLKNQIFFKPSLKQNFAILNFQRPQPDSAGN